jgi:cobalamin transport system ATP-binding protein
MTVTDYVLLGRTPYIPYLGSESRRDLAIVADVLDHLDLGAFAGRALDSLSGGERQRAVLARALAQQAPVLLLDEPTTGLDVGHQQQVLELVDSLRRDLELTVVSAMHDLTLAGQFADHLVLLDGGRVAADGPARTVLTERVISQHYHASVRVLEDPAGGIVVIPVRPGGRTGGPAELAEPAEPAERQVAT